MGKMGVGACIHHQVQRGGAMLRASCSQPLLPRPRVGLCGVLRSKERPGRALVTKVRFKGSADGRRRAAGGAARASMTGKPGRVHFIGIGGTGLSALALVALKQGWRVSGSDATWNERMKALQEEGATVHVGHCASLLQDSEGFKPDAVVVSSAVPEDNDELQAARALAVPIYKRDAWLAKITQGYELVAVAGSHGKTTTTAMLAMVLRGLGEDITVVVGAEVPQFPSGGNAIVGQGRRFVLEADEYDSCFLGVDPWMAIVTNVEWEHVDMFPDEASVRNVFRKFVSRIKEGGTLVLCGDSAGSKSLARAFEENNESMPNCRASWLDKKAPYQVVTYGLGKENDWQALLLAPNVRGGSDYVAVHDGAPMARISLRIPGTHNVLNSLAVLVAVSLLSVQEKRAGDGTAQLKMMRDSAEAASRILSDFGGVRRRFEFVGAARRCQIFDDYAHHPTEVRAVLQAARQRFDQQPIWVVFQPHTYSRLAKLLEDFAPAFSAADRVIITKVYSAREENLWNISGQNLATAIMGPPAVYIQELEDVVKRLSWEVAATCNAGQCDIILLTLGAGDITTVGPRLLESLSSSATI